ncbi:O-antigen ligase family protein [Thermodesulfobacteriota bacterium]
MVWHNLKSELEKDHTDSRSFNLLNQSVVVLMCALIFINPFPHIQTTHEIAFYFAVFTVLVLVLSKKIKLEFNTPLTTPFILYASWAFIGLFFALDKLDSAHDFYSHLLKYIILYYILINFFSSKNRLILLSWMILISATIFSVVSLFYFYITLGNPLSMRFGQGFPNSATNVMGYTTVFALLLSFHYLKSERRLYPKLFLIISFIFLSAASFLPQSRGTILAAVFAFFIILKRKKTYSLFVGIVIVLIVWSPLKDRIVNPEYYHDRLFLTFFSLEIIKDYPIIGVGYSLDALKNHNLIDPVRYKARLPEKYRSYKYPGTNIEYAFILPHSMFLNVPVRLGLVGLGLFLYILFAFSKMSWTLTKNGENDFIKSWNLVIFSAFVMFVVKGAFEPIDTHIVEVIYFTIFSMMTILWRLNEEEDPGGYVSTL